MCWHLRWLLAFGFWLMAFAFAPYACFIYKMFFQATVSSVSFSAIARTCCSLICTWGSTRISLCSITSTRTPNQNLDAVALVCLFVCTSLGLSVGRWMYYVWNAHRWIKVHILNHGLANPQKLCMNGSLLTCTDTEHLATHALLTMTVCGCGWMCLMVYLCVKFRSNGLSVYVAFHIVRCFCCVIG